MSSAAGGPVTRRDLSREPRRVPKLGEDSQPRWRDPTIVTMSGRKRITGATKPSYVTFLVPETTPTQLTIRDRNNAFARTQIGDTVWIVVESAGFAGTFRTLSRGIESSQDEMTLD